MFGPFQTNFGLDVVHSLDLLKMHIFAGLTTRGPRTWAHFEADVRKVFMNSGKKKEHKDDLLGSGDCRVGWGSSTRRVFHVKGWWSKSSFPTSRVCGLLGSRREGTWHVSRNLPGCPGPLVCSKSFVQKKVCPHLRFLCRCARFESGSASELNRANRIARFEKNPKHLKKTSKDITANQTEFGVAIRIVRCQSEKAKSPDF